MRSLKKEISWFDRVLLRHGLVLITTRFELAGGQFSQLVAFERAWWAERFFYDRVNDLERRVLFELKASTVAEVNRLVEEFRLRLKRES